MALIKCTECREDVSSTASKCPHCGTWAPGGKGKAATGCVVPMVFIILLVAWVGGAFNSGDLPRSEATFEQVDDAVGCGSGSKDTNSKKAHLFETNYKSHRMTWTGKVLSADGARVSLNMNLMPGSELDVYFADINAVHSLGVDDEITVDFTMEDAGGCFTPYEGRDGRIVGQKRSATPPEQSVMPKQVSQQTLEKTITVDNQFGCGAKDDYENIIRYATSGDKDAFVRGLSDNISDGRCVMFNRGDSVFLTDTSLLSGMVKLRRKGKTSEYWTAMEAIR